MSEQPEPMDAIGAALLGGLGQLSASMHDAMRPDRFEYARVPWLQVNELARDGWQLVPVNPSYGDSNEALFMMQRTLGVADEAAGLLGGE